MIDNTRYRLYLLVMVVLVLIGLGLFTFSHFFYQRALKEATATVYVARTTVNAFESVKTSQFQPVEVPLNGVLQGSITDISAYEGQYTRHKLYAGELLMESQLSKESLIQEGDLIIPLEGTYVSEIRPQDVVAIYTLRVLQGDNDQRVVKIERLFSAKKIYPNGRDQDVWIPVEGETYGTYIKVSENEMNAYYTALQESSLIIAKHVDDVAAVMEKFKNLNTGDYAPSNSLISHLGEILTPNNSQPNHSNSSDSTLTDKTESEEAKENDRPTLLYTVGKNETWETLAIKFKTTEEVLKTLNPKVTNLKQGTELLVPGI